MQSSTNYSGAAILEELSRPTVFGEINLRNTLGKFRGEYIQVGIGHDGRYHVLIPNNSASSSNVTSFPKFSGIEIKERKISIGGINDVSKIDVSTHSEFDLILLGAIVDELVLKLESNDDPLELLVSICERWQELLTIKSIPELQMSLAIGLYGELLVLETLLSISQDRSISNWTGPIRHRHDFEFENVSLEVKTSTRTDQSTAVIHGIDQLEVADGKELFLCFLRLEWDPDGRSLGTLISDIKELGVRVEDFESKLSMSGVKPGFDLERFKFALHDARLFPVDQDFPCITADSIAKIMPLERLVAIDYTLNLSGLDGIKLTTLDAIWPAIRD